MCVCVCVGGCGEERFKIFLQEQKYVKRPEALINLAMALNTK